MINDKIKQYRRNIKIYWFVFFISLVFGVFRITSIPNESNLNEIVGVVSGFTCDNNLLSSNKYVFKIEAFRVSKDFHVNGNCQGVDSKAFLNKTATVAYDDNNRAWDLLIAKQKFISYHTTKKKIYASVIGFCALVLVFVALLVVMTKGYIKKAELNK